MAASEDLINFDIIENQKENIQSLPGGRSARELARIFSPRNPEDKLSSPSPNDTRTLNDAIRQEYEAELQTIAESDDPLDIYDRYVKWALNAYPTAQATPESGLLPLLERAVRAFLSSNHYKNDPRYLRLWLHYIRLFSDAPRETFAFLARHHIGEGLALFYEEFAAWLESAGRWTQADEVYRLGVDREARPAERLIRKYGEFQQRYENHTQDNGPSSPALPTVRPALAAKVDPFSSSSTPADPQAQRPTGVGGAPKSKSGKPKMAIFSDAGAANEPALGDSTKGWESIGSLRDRKKENTMEAKPWAGETLKAGKKSGPTQKMAIFRDESNSNSHVKEPIQSKHVPEHRVREAVNPRTGRRERVFVNLEAIYPDYTNPCNEVSFEELRAISRGWMDRDWRSQKQPLKQISGNSLSPDPENSRTEELPETFNRKLSKGSDSHQAEDAYEGKAGKARKLKLREIKGETQTIKMNFDSPTKHKIRRKSTNEPTMTIHTRAATDEIYDIFNQPLKAESGPSADSDFEDDDCTSVGDTTVGHLSATSSDFGDDDTHSFRKSYYGGDGYDDMTQAESVAGSEWTEFTASRDIPDVSPTRPSTELTSQDVDDELSDASSPRRPARGKFIPEMPEDYVPPIGTYRDPEVMAQNRLPFMTPIVEQTEHSLASMTAARSNIYNAKTPSKPMLDAHQTPYGMPPIGDLLLSSPTGSPDEKEDFTGLADEVVQSPTAKKVLHSPRLAMPLSKKARQRDPVIKDKQCNPTDAGIRRAIIQSLDPPMASYPGYQAHEKESNYAVEVQKFMKALSRRAKSGGETAFEIPVLEFPNAARNYIIRRELGAGAYAPVYLSESVPSSENDADATDRDPHSNGKLLSQRPRDGFEAIKLEVGPPSAWEFYMIRTAHERIAQNPELARAADSIIRAHELHVFKTESFLIEDYCGQGTLLDLVNIIRNESLATNPSAEGGLDEALAMFFAVELFRIVEALHASGILHGDIKADNCLIRFDDTPGSPSLIDSTDDEDTSNASEAYYSPRGSHGWANKGLSFIDFGRSIDMHAFHPSVQFTADWDPSTHECNEVRERRPWTHQIDLYGIAGTIHVMLFGKYLESTPDPKAPTFGPANTPTYRIRETLKRYWERELWSDVFDLLLNPGRDRWVEMERGSDMSQDENAVPGPVFPVLKSMRFLRGRMEAWLVENAQRRGLAAQIHKLEATFADKRRKFERRW